MPRTRPPIATSPTAIPASNPWSLPVDGRVGDVVVVAGDVVVVVGDVVVVAVDVKEK